VTRTAERKAELRERVWQALEEAGVARAPLPLHGRIPNFDGADAAAWLLSQVDEFRRARTIKVNPDSPQRPLRLLVLKSGKILVVPTPRMAGGFLMLDPRSIPGKLHGLASTISGARQLGRTASLTSLPKVDLMVAGSVAVDAEGNRLGKGAGYSEIEYAVLTELGLVDKRTPIATTIHELQLVSSVPVDLFDLQVNIVATPDRIIRTTGGRDRSPGIFWGLLGSKNAKSIPILDELKSRRQAKGRPDTSERPPELDLPRKDT